VPVPVRVTPPATAVVLLADLKEHLRVDHADDDALITAYEAAAVAYLDGWRGILGRCILSQQWAVTYGEAGTYRLPLPDVSEVSVDAGTATLEADCLGALVTITEAATVTMTCEMPEDALPTVQMAIKLLVGHWYQNREAASDTRIEDAPLAFNALIAPLRWVGV
jgi:hypothetical protein